MQQQQAQFYPQNGLPQPGSNQPAPGQQPFPGVARPPMRPANPGIPGIDPRQMAQARQALTQPNQGDGFNRNLPRPANQNRPSLPPMQPTTGAPGLPAQQAALMNQAATGQAPAEAVENPLEDIVPPPMEMLKGGALGVGMGLAMNEVMKNNRLINVAGHLDGIPGISHLSNGLDNLLKKHLQPRVPGREYFLDTIYKEGKSASEAVRLMQDNHIKKAFENFEKKLPGFNWNRYRHLNTFEAIVEAANKDLASGIYKGKEAKILTNFRQYMKSNQNYLPLFESKARLAEQMVKTNPNMGVIGRGFANTVNYINRIFGGQAVMENMGMKTGAAASGGGSSLFGKILGPFMMGFLMCGTAFNKAKKAEKGEKIKTFFHEFLGAGLGNFIGWEVGVSFLKSFQVMDKLLGKNVGLRPLRWIPLLGRFTLGGILTQLVAMFVIAVPFQKAFEGLSNALFGKLKEKPKKAPPPNLPPGQLNRNGFERFKRTQAEQSKAIGNETPPAFSITPEAISQSMAEMRQNDITSQIMGAPWDLHKTLDPFSTGH